MRRREFLGTAGAGGIAGLAGCLGILQTRSSRVPPVVETRPDAVYYPTHYEGMKIAGKKRTGGYECALTYTFPHRFWLMTGTRVEKVTIKPEDSVHLMPIVWDAETGIVPPDVNPQLRISKGESSVAQLAPWPMLSQPMGFHFGDNVALDGDGEYAVEVSIGAPSTRRTGSLADSEGEVSFEFDFGFSQSDLDGIRYVDVPDGKQGTKGAVSPMGMSELPETQAPNRGGLPGEVRATAESGDAEFVVTVLEDATPFGGGEDEVYLAVSPRTPHNRYVLPMMSVSGTLKRGGSTVFDGILQSTIDPELRYHYGAAVPRVAAGDRLRIGVGAPPQTARHEGYETAFIEMGPMDVTL